MKKKRDAGVQIDDQGRGVMTRYIGTSVLYSARRLQGKERVPETTQPSPLIRLAGGPSPVMLRTAQSTAVHSSPGPLKVTFRGVASPQRSRPDHTLPLPLLLSLLVCGLKQFGSLTIAQPWLIRYAPSGGSEMPSAPRRALRLMSLTPLVPLSSCPLVMVLVI